MDTLRAEFQQERLQTAVQTAVQAAQNVPVPLNTSVNNMTRDAAIRHSGGLAMWHKLPIRNREAALGVTQIYSDAEVSQIFGHSSKGADASRLATMNPAKYRALKICAIERGLY